MFIDWDTSRFYVLIWSTAYENLQKKIFCLCNKNIFFCCFLFFKRTIRGQKAKSIVYFIAHQFLCKTFCWSYCIFWILLFIYFSQQALCTQYAFTVITILYFCQFLIQQLQHLFSCICVRKSTAWYEINAGKRFTVLLRYGPEWNNTQIFWLLSKDFCEPQCSGANFSAVISVQNWTKTNVGAHAQPKIVHIKLFLLHLNNNNTHIHNNNNNIFEHTYLIICAVISRCVRQQ